MKSEICGRNAWKNILKNQTKYYRYKNDIFKKVNYIYGITIKCNTKRIICSIITQQYIYIYTYIHIYIYIATR